MRGWLRVLSGACLMILGFLVGCGPVHPPPPSVSGVVTLEGEPFFGGRVTLFGSGGTIESGTIQPDGTYLINRAPLGHVRASIVQLTPNSFLSQQAGKDGSEPAHHSFKNKPVARARSEEAPSPVLPQRYANPEYSGLSFTVVPGPQTRDFHLRIDDPLVSRPPGSGQDVGTRVGLGVGQLAPDIKGEDFDGRPFSLRGYRGQVVVLTFWAHW